MSDDSNNNANPNVHAAAAAAPHHSARSCITCRRRKVKCDKKQPCANCLRARIECFYPGPGRAPRKSRKLPDTELLERLRRLEGVVQNLNAQVEEHEHEAAERERESSSRKNSSAAVPLIAAVSPAEACFERNDASRASVAVDNSVEGLESRFGRLVIEKGRSRYINNSFWASLNNEVEDLKAVLIEPSDDEDDDPNNSNSNSAHSSSSEHAGHHQGFILGYSSTSVDMRALHPAPDVARRFWETYKISVDPLLKIIHIPTFNLTFAEAIARPEKVHKGLESLLFAIYYGAVTSTPPDECRALWGEDRAVLLNRYRFAVEQALARANFLYCDEMVILQAFIIYLILLRRNDDARKIWTLTGLAVRIAQTLGIHRDGSHFSLDPFEIEMRRRLWWQVCVLDARSSEDHGCDPTIVEAQFDAKMPLNINDADIHPRMTSFPEERQGFTDMTFSLVRFEVANILRRIQYIPPGPVRCNQLFANLSIEDKERWITECNRKMEEKYLKDCDMTNPLCWVTATISRLIMSKMWLIVYHPHQRKDGGASLPQITKDRLFITSLENVEYSLLLETEARTMKWSWLFRTYVQWHAIAFLLSELCVRTKGAAVERAWRALEATAGRWWFPLNHSSANRKGQQGCLWMPLRKLLAKARAARERELMLEKASLALQNGQNVLLSSYFDTAAGGGLEYTAKTTTTTTTTAMSSPTMPQPSSENLDKLLRPSAPRLGEKDTMASPTVWTDSPPMLNTYAPVTGSDGDGFFHHGQGHGQQQQQQQHQQQQHQQQQQQQQQNQQQQQQQQPQKPVSPGQAFDDMTNFGLDNVMLDIMAGTTMADYAPLDAQQQHISAPPPPAPAPLQSPQAAFAAAAAAVANPDLAAPAGDGSAGALNAAAYPTDMNADGTWPGDMFMDDGSGGGGDGGGGGSIDWTMWDDMVSQYGIDGQAVNHANAAANGHMGLMHFL